MYVNTIITYQITVLTNRWIIARLYNGALILQYKTPYVSNRQLVRLYWIFPLFSVIGNADDYYTNLSLTQVYSNNPCFCFFLNINISTLRFNHAIIGHWAYRSLFILCEFVIDKELNKSSWRSTKHKDWCLFHIDRLMTWTLQ